MSNTPGEVSLEQFVAYDLSDTLSLMDGQTAADNSRDHASEKSSSGMFFELLKDYFINSEEKWIAWLLLVGIIITVVVIVGLTAAFAWWSTGFWAVLVAKAMIPFLISIGQFALLVSAFTAMQVLKNYLVCKLSILWRNWLTNSIIDKLFNSETNYLDLKRFSDVVDNIAQRIQEDVKSFVELTLNLATDFLRSTLTLATFIGSLWVAGGAFSFVFSGVAITIPGFLVWVALAVAGLATVATYFIGKSLATTNQMAEQTEADLRQDLEQVNEEAENIAEEHAEHYYKKNLEHDVDNLNEIANKKLNAQSKLVAFQSFYMQISTILPYLLAAPLYFTGVIALEALTQIGMSFGQVSSSLSWFVESYENLGKLQTSVNRIFGLQQAFEKEGLAANSKSIIRTDRDKESINIKQLSIMKPQISSTQYMMRNLNLKLVPGEHVLFKAPSGLGKSTLFKAISGTWKYGTGKIKVPANKSMFFLPQKPTLPNDTLSAVLAYPEAAGTYDDDKCIEALHAVGGMDDFIPMLHEKRAWSKELSGGQQQRISFARALLKKPDWLFLDEATSALDEDSERHVYSVIKTLKDTTIVSIAHRSTVEKHHTKIAHLKVNEDREVAVDFDYPGLN